jgi:tetratricopeptide (TPR) repeat protein
MGDMFQLSVELYDTKDKKVVWSDRWQEKWDNLPTIKGSLSDGLLKALDTKPKVEQKIDTTNPEAYEFYLKASHKYAKRENTDDTEIARGLLQKAIELDDNLIYAKILLGATYMEMGDYDEAMEIYTPALKQAEELGDKRGMGLSLNSIGIVHASKGDYDKALDYLGGALAIKEELGNKQGIGGSLNNIGLAYSYKGYYNTALDYYGRSLAIQEELGDKRGMGLSLGNIGIVHYYKGYYDTALDYLGGALAIKEELGDKGEMGYSFNSIGVVHADKGDYEKATKYLEKSLAIHKEIGLKGLELETTTYLYLSYKHLGKDYNEKQIHRLIKDAENIEFQVNFRLYQLLEDKSYLETAYKQVQENASAMEDGKKYLSYPIPKQIVEEWKTLNKDNN